MQVRLMKLPIPYCFKGIIEGLLPLRTKNDKQKIIIIVDSQTFYFNSSDTSAAISWSNEGVDTFTCKII